LILAIIRSIISIFRKMLYGPQYKQSKEGQAMKVGLEALASYFPEKVVKREDFSYLEPVIPKGMERIFRGPDEFRRFQGDHAAETMGEMAAKKVLDEAKLKPADIDFIIAGNLGGDFGIPMIGTYLHDKLKFPREVPVVNMQNCCAGFVDACNLAWNLVRAGEYKRILVVMSTAFDAKGKAGCVVDQTTPMGKLFGDGAAAAIVSAQNLKCEFVSYASRTFGELYFHMCSSLIPTEHPEFLKQPEIPMGTYLWADQWFFEWQQRDGKRFAIE
jgi:3-oxoacyl-[acyl-carrier-protein] synthase III